MRSTAELLDRVRASSPRRANEHVDQELKASARRHAGAEANIGQRLLELEKEWDMERVLQTNAATLGLTGVLLGGFVDRRWLILPGAVMAFLVQHALQGWCPPVPVFRMLGLRTRKEIDMEKYALKALRGDFDGVTEPERPSTRANRAVRAARDGRG